MMYIADIAPPTSPSRDRRGDRDPEHALGEFGVDPRELWRHGLTQQAQRLGRGRWRLGDALGRSKAKPVLSSTSSRLWPGWMLSRRKRARSLSKPKWQSGVTSAIGPPRRKTLGGLVPGALMKSTFSTSVRRECSSRKSTMRGTMK